MRVTCGACVKEENVATLSFGPEGIQIKLTPPWRVRNAAFAQSPIGLLPGPAAVFLCSDICEERYGNAVGFWKKD